MAFFNRIKAMLQERVFAIQGFQVTVGLLVGAAIAAWVLFFRRR